MKGWDTTTSVDHTGFVERQGRRHIVRGAPLGAKKNEVFFSSTEEVRARLFFPREEIGISATNPSFPPPLFLILCGDEFHTSSSSPPGRHTVLRCRSLGRGRKKMAEASDIVKVVQPFQGFNLGHNDVIGICLDIETIGACMTKNAMVELGAMAICVGECDERMTLGTFEGYMKIPDGCGFEKRCESEFWDVHKVDQKKRVVACQTEPTDVMHAFVDWVYAVHKRYVGDDSEVRVRFLSDASYFDAGWVSHYLTKYADHHPLHLFFSSHEKTRFSPVLDTNAFYRGIARTTPNDELTAERGPDGWFSADKAVRNALAIPDDKKPSTKHDHRAVNDATNIMMKYNIVMLYIDLHNTVLKSGNESQDFAHNVVAATDSIEQSLEDATNCMPHALTIFNEDKTAVVYQKDRGYEPLRLVESMDKAVACQVLIDSIGVPEFQGKRVAIACRMGTPKYDRLNVPPPDGPVIVSDLVARHLLETGFKHAIYSPDTNPTVVVRNDKGAIVGTTRLVRHI